MYIHINVCTMHMYVCIHDVCIYMWIYVCMYHVCMYHVCMYVCIMYVCSNVCMVLPVGEHVTGESTFKNSCFTSLNNTEPE